MSPQVDSQQSEKSSQSLEKGTYVDVSQSPKPHVADKWAEQFKALSQSRRAVLAAFACSTTPILIGYDLTLIGSIIANNEFVETMGVYNDHTAAWSLPANRQLVWTIVQFVSAISCAFLSGYLNDIFGRRVCFLITVSLTIIGSLIELFSPSWTVWIVAKLFMGAAMGFMQGNVQTYVSEITPVTVRGFTLSLFQFWINVGSFLASCVLEGTSHVSGPWSWKAAIVSQFGPALFCLVLFIPLVPESPYFLLSKNRVDAARAALLKLRGSELGFDVEAEIIAMQDTLLHEQQDKKDASSYIECFQGTNLRRTLLACLPMIMQIFMGYPIAGNYLAYFLKLSGVDNAFLITMIAIILALLSSVAAFFLIERIGRRPQLLGGAFCMLPCLLAISLLGWVGSGVARGQALAAFCIIWNAFYYLSVGAVGWTIVGEISSSRLRAKTTSIAAMSNGVFNMGWSIAIPYLVNAEEANLGPKAALIFLGCGTVLALTSFFTIPETKGKTFHELDTLFEAGTKARKF